MAGRLIKEVSQTISAFSAQGVITVASTTGLYERAYAYLANAGQPGLTVRILQILNATTLAVKTETDPRGGGAGNTSAYSITPSTNYGRSAATAYNGGTLTQPEQLVQNPNDLGLA